MSTNRKSLFMTALLLSSLALAGCYSASYSYRYRPNAGSVLFSGTDFFSGKHHATFFHSRRFESDEIREFLMRTLDRDLRWADGNRDLRITREEQERAWGLATIPAPTLLTGARDVDEIMDRLYGTTDGQ